ncbi:TetR/AcrR family transcriptional regulator [Acerihabitans sp.]|uniref:TetR/AcrR family transcriptional regulator n=1 Tax=Acerihabitans sp. TaxID=2811394 RepID=UPI002EDA4ACA
MARPKEFDIDIALDAAIEVFREHGFAGSSTQMLTKAMRIGKQSLYDTFGDKWRLYCSALQKYARAETAEHIKILQEGVKAIEGVERMIERVVAQARRPCLGVGSINEFADSHADLVDIRLSAGRALRVALLGNIARAKLDGDMGADLNPEQGAAFLLANVAAIRLAARGGASQAELSGLARLTLKALK